MSQISLDFVFLKYKYFFFFTRTYYERFLLDSLNKFLSVQIIFANNPYLDYTIKTLKHKVCCKNFVFVLQFQLFSYKNCYFLIQETNGLDISSKMY